MDDRLREFVEDFRLHWDDPYWWADHQLLQAALACMLVGTLTLGFKYAELRMAQTMQVGS